MSLCVLCFRRRQHDSGFIGSRVADQPDRSDLFEQGDSHDLIPREPRAPGMRPSPRDQVLAHKTSDLRVLARNSGRDLEFSSMLLKAPCEGPMSTKDTHEIHSAGFSI